MPAQRRRRRAALGASAAAALLGLLLTGCAGAPADDEALAAELREVVAERDAIGLAAHADTLDRLAAFLREKWGPVSLPDEPVIRWVEADEWGGLMSECLAQRGFPGAKAADDGQRVDYSGVRVEGIRELYLIDVAGYSCQSAYPVRQWYAAQVAEVEIDWAYRYVGAALPACLLAHGFEPAPLPARDRFGADWRTDAAWDAYALVGASPFDRATAEARCPSPETLLDAVP